MSCSQGLHGISSYESLFAIYGVIGGLPMVLLLDQRTQPLGRATFIPTAILILVVIR